jgi:hypothetical protein
LVWFLGPATEWQGKGRFKLGKRKLEIVSNFVNCSLLTEAETLNAFEQSKQIDWSFYPELYQAKLRRVRRAIDALVAKSREHFALQDLDSND